MIRHVRGRDPKRCLLLLYPLSPKDAGVGGSVPIIGFGVSFPESRDAKPVSYQVNNVYWEQEYGAEA